MKQGSRCPTRAAAFEASDDRPSNPTLGDGRPTIGDIINARFSRRGVLKGMLGTAAIAGLACSGLTGLASPRATAAAGSRFRFEEIEHGIDETHHVAPGYRAEVLIRWGDPLFSKAPDFDPLHQSADAQERQFGYNNDYIGYLPLEAQNGEEDRALLCVNHEYTSEEVMFPGIGLQDQPLEEGGKGFFNMTRELVEIEQAAHGGTIVEVVKRDGKWAYVKDSPYNRRISARSTQMLITGPAAGHERLKTSWDRHGNRVVGTLNNCAGGMTPWGTYLMAEENFHGYFMGELTPEHPEASNYERYGVPGNWQAWGLYDTRFDINAEPHEANRFGWVVEVDPKDPYSIPQKRTALGRFKHEGAAPTLSKDGRVVLYMGDDERFDYVYKFVTAGTFNPDDATANADLLDDGTLYVARFAEDGSLTWLPLVHGQGPLTAGNGFHSQADVVIETRRAADLLGATPMDRPEGVQADPRSGRVYVMLTNNTKRAAEQANAANPRGPNPFGHILEIQEPEGDLAASSSRWEVLVRCGDPAVAEVGAQWNPATSENGWFAAPDNCAVDSEGRLWVTTDQGSGWFKTGTADGVFGLETEGGLRATGKMFFRAPVGAELCGPCFTPDNRTLFVAVQHPAIDGVADYEPFGRESSFEDPATRWPDFKEDMPPRPSVVVICKDDEGPIGA